MAEAYLLLGSNMGDRFAILRTAIKTISEQIGVVQRLSSVYQTAPWGFQAETPFLNQVALVKTNLSPEELLAKTQEIETALGRKRTDNGFSSRPIDIDILFYDDYIIYQKNLIVPHLHLHKRKFVLVPLHEIAPTLLHPVTHKSITNLLNNCTDNLQVEKIFDS